MDRLFFALALALTAKWISLLTGRNRRQLQKVPEGMSILCQPPGKRYILYALGVVVMAVVLFFGVLYLLDGAPESARPMWGLCIAVAVLTLGVCILGGNIQAKDCVYYDEEKFQVNRPFREPQVSIRGARSARSGAALTGRSRCIRGMERRSLPRGSAWCITRVSAQCSSRSVRAARWNITGHSTANIHRNAFCAMGRSIICWRSWEF